MSVNISGSGIERLWDFCMWVRFAKKASPESSPSLSVEKVWLQKRQSNGDTVSSLSVSESSSSLPFKLLDLLLLLLLFADALSSVFFSTSVSKMSRAIGGNDFIRRLIL